MNREEKIAVFEPLLNQFETEQMKAYCEDMIETIPDYIFEIPSSTSSKFHNATQCQPHGQIYHIIMFGEIMNHRLNLKGNKEKFKSPTQRDAMRCTPIFHDALKCGENGKQTVFDHPLLAGKWVRETKVEHDIDDKTKEAIARMCERHSGEWVTSKKSDLVLPEPENAMELFVHECDYLSSRNNIDMPIPNHLKVIFGEAELPDINTHLVTFGKHKGKTLVEINEIDKGWIHWAKENIHRHPEATLLKQL